MANPNKGEVSFDVEGVTYTLRYTVNALCEVEQATGLGIVRVYNELADPATFKLATLRAAIWAGLRDKHPRITLVEAGDLIVKAGGAGKMLEKLGEAIRVAFPPQDGDADIPPELAGQQSATTGSIN